MKIVVAPDSFKGSLEAFEICDIVENTAKNIFENCEVLKMPIADGGEGTVKSLISALNAKEQICNTHDPLGRMIESVYGIFGNCAIMEMAQASGLPLVKENERDILKHSTYGTGEMLNDAIQKGCKKIYMGIGGSATNDGGIGFAAAIGAVFYDKNKNKLEPIPENFMKIQEIDVSQIDLKDTEIIVMCDVSNPLLGEKGATYIFGKQKGAKGETLEILEKGMTHYIEIVEKTVSKEIKTQSGAGAAGGLGAALLAYTNATLKSGVETVLEVLDFKNKIQGADLVITGEGMMDYQSAYGKVAYGVGKICKEQNIACTAIVGSMGKDACAMYNHGINSIVPTVNGVMTLDNALENVVELCQSAAYRLLSLVKIGMNIK
ncbi:MAG: glycerate kinase [Clostridia bacterium]